MEILNINFLYARLIIKNSKSLFLNMIFFLILCFSYALKAYINDKKYSGEDFLSIISS